MGKEDGMEEYHQGNRPRTSGAEICGEPWMPRSFGNAHVDESNCYETTSERAYDFETTICGNNSVVYRRHKYPLQTHVKMTKR